MRRYQGDPRWITARFSGTCSGCKTDISKGDEAFYFPQTSALFGKSCGCAEQHSARFEAEAFDDEFSRR